MSARSRRKPRANTPIVSYYDMGTLPWKAAGPPGLWQQDIRSDRDTGRYFGSVKLEPLSRSGVHRHLGPVSAFLLTGVLTDYHMRAVGGQALVNMTGAVHDVIAYQETIAVSRVEGPVLYARDEDGLLNELGEKAAAAGAQVEDTIALPPNICIDPETLVAVPGPVTGASRRLLYDYANDACDMRYAQLLLRPGTRVPRHRTRGMTDWFVLAGTVEVNGERIGSGHYVVIEPDAEMDLESHYGARLLTWAEGPVSWLDDGATGDLYGF